jgi:serine/threonine protein kinase
MSKPFANFSDGSPVPLDGNFHVDPINPMTSVRYLEPWFPPGVVKVFSGGNTARLGFLSDGSVLKFPIDKEDPFTRKALDIEDLILLALGDHERLVQYLGKHEQGLRFKFAVNGNIRHYISKQEPGSISLQLRQRWLQQAAQVVAFVHSKGVIHCDIHPSNLLLDEHFNLQLCDFSGSLFGELDGAAMESTRYFLPRDPLSTPNIRSDLFALGSTMYYIMSGHEPYDTLSESEVTALYSQGLFPEVDGMVWGDVIKGCWKGCWSNAEEVVQALDKSHCENKSE